MLVTEESTYKENTVVRKSSGEIWLAGEFCEKSDIVIPKIRQSTFDCYKKSKLKRIKSYGFGLCNIS